MPKKEFWTPELHRAYRAAVAILEAEKKPPVKW